MVRRLLAFALALVVIGAPLAGDACGAFCAAHAIDPIPVSPHDASVGVSPASHHHHAEFPPVPAPATGDAALRTVSHECAQVDAVVAESRELTRAPIVGAATGVVRLTPVLARALTPSDVDGRHGPPAPIRSISPLRI
jgi:hypothetical protein